MNHTRTITIPIQYRNNIVSAINGAALPLPPLQKIYNFKEFMRSFLCIFYYSIAWISVFWDYSL